MRPALALSAAALTLILLAASGPVHAQTRIRGQDAAARKASPIDWGSANRELTRALITNDIGALAKTAMSAPAPQTPREWLYRLALLTRADYREQTLAFLKTRPAFLDPQTDWGLSGAVNEAGGHGNLPLARRLSELFPETATLGPWLREWAGATPAGEVDRWLGQQGYVGGDVWFHERVRRRAALGTEAELLTPLAQAVREHPADEDRLLRYLKAVEATGRSQTADWLVSVLRPGLAVQSYLLAAHFPLPASVAIALLERSLDQPFTAGDVQRHAEYELQHPSPYRASLTPVALTEKQLRARTRQALLQFYQQGGQPQKAQAMLEALARENPDGFLAHVGGEVAGQVQANSGARVVETKIRAEEPLKQDSAEYWLQRGQYYTGRNEEAQALAALDKALALTPIPAPGKPSIRYQVVQAYARQLWLRDIDHPKDALAFLRAQLALTPSPSYLAEVIVSEMLSYSHGDIAYDDPLLWSHLATLPEWHAHGQSLLQRLVAAAPAAQRDAQWARARSLIVGDAVPQRWALARAMRNSEDWAGAARAYVSLLEHLRDPSERAGALVDLWAIYQRQSDLAGMQRIFPQLRAQNYWENNLALPYLELAVAAGQSGAKAEAARYFRQWSNQDRRLAPSFYPLPSLGILPEIRALYQALERDEPQCAAAARALAMIGRTN